MRALLTILCSFSVVVSVLPTEAAAQRTWPSSTAQPLRISLVDSLPPGWGDGMLIRRASLKAGNDILLLRAGKQHGALLASSAELLREAVTTSDTRDNERRYFIWRSQILERAGRRRAARLDRLATRVSSAATSVVPGYGRVQTLSVRLNALE